MHIEDFLNDDPAQTSEDDNEDHFINPETSEIMKKY